MIAQANPRATRRSIVIELPDLAAGVDIAAEVVYEADQNIAIRGARWIFREGTVGVDGANTLQFTASSPSGIFSDTGVLVANEPAARVLNPALTGANIGLNPGQNITISITQGATANIGRMALEITFEERVS